MSNDSEQHRTGPHRASPWELGPQWIIALATLVAAMTTAGFFAGKTIDNTSQGNAAPGPVTSSTPTAAPSTQSSSPPASPSPAVAGGTKIATYTFQIVRGYAVPLGDTAPKQADFVDYGTGGDVGFNGNYSSLVPMDQTYKMIGLDKQQPSFEACTTSSVFVGSVQLAIGKTFCLLKPGRIIGGKIVSAGPVVGQPVGIEITIWAAPS